MGETTRHFVSRVYAVKEGKVLLIKGKKGGQWLPPGGHVKMDELPTQTAVREVMEETGQKIVLRSAKNKKIGSAHMLPQPDHMEVHDISEDHQHIAFIYFAELGEKPEGGTKDGSRETRWFTPEEIDAETMRDSVKFFAKKAIKDMIPEKEPEPSPPVKEKKSVLSKMKEGAKKMTEKAKSELKRGGEKSPEEMLEEQKSELETGEERKAEKTQEETPEKSGEK